MFIFNMKIKGNKIVKTSLFITFILSIFLLIFSVYSIYKKAENENTQSKDNIQTYEISSADYTNFLKDAHENINNYTNIKVKITGYIYRMPDFTDKQFVLSRTMILNSANSGVVVGILAEYDNAKEFLDNEWVEVTGTIEKGDYKGEMPILKVEKINKCEVPDDEYVYPPSMENFNV